MSNEPKFRTNPDRIERFRRNYALDQNRLANLMGLAPKTEGRAVRMWKTTGGAPAYVELMLRYMEKDDLAEALREKPVHRTSAEIAALFKAKYGLTHQQFDRLFAHEGSRGRASRRWTSEGGPGYVDTLIRYMARYGLEIAESFAVERENPLAEAA